MHPRRPAVGTRVSFFDPRAANGLARGRTALPKPGRHPSADVALNEPLQVASAMCSTPPPPYNAGLAPPYNAIVQRGCGEPLLPRTMLVQCWGCDEPLLPRTMLVQCWPGHPSPLQCWPLCILRIFCSDGQPHVCSGGAAQKMARFPPPLYNNIYPPVRLAKPKRTRCSGSEKED